MAKIPYTSNDIEKINELAESNGWSSLECVDDVMLSFYKIVSGKRQRINILVSTRTVATALNHPKRGKTQLFRRNVSVKLLETLFKNPRFHTQKGYYTK